MSQWIIRRNIPYEGLHEEWCDSAQEVINYLDNLSGLDMDDVEGIVPVTTGGYDLWSFREAFEKGEIT